MANRFWVGGTGNWDATTTTHWSGTSGGAGGASVPGSSDPVFFDNNSGSPTVTITATATANSITCSHSGVTLNAGANLINVTSGAFNWDWQSGTFGAGTSTVSMGAAGNTIINAVGMSFYNLTKNGTAVKTDTLTFNVNTTITNTFTVAGQSAINRLVVKGNTPATPRTLTVNGSVSAARVDFQDIIGAGSASWNLSAGSGGIGDRGNNTGITFTTAATQTANGTTSFNWSTAARWTSRVPLPQDDVIVNNAFSASQTITMDQPVLGRDIDFTGVTGSPAVDVTIAMNMYGSLTLSTGLGTITMTGAIRLSGTGTHNITTNTKTISGGAAVVQVFSNGGTYNLQDDFTITTTNGFQVIAGTFNTNNYTLSANTITPFSLGVLPFTLNLGSSIINLTGTATGNIWAANNSGALTNINAGTSEIVVQNTSANTRTFSGAGHTYNKLTYTVAGSTGELDIVGSNTFNTLNFSDASNARTLAFTAGTTNTFTTFNVFGTAGKLMTIGSITAASHTLSKPTGMVSGAYLSISRSTATGGASWYAGSTSTDGGNNTGWVFADAPLATGGFFNLM